MSAPNSLTEQQVDPLASVDHLLHSLTSLTAHCALGLVVGLLAARLMRMRHLHWSWAAVAFALVVLARGSLSGAVVLTLSVAALSALRRGRRWHREDMDSGEDLAELAARRVTPLDGLRHLARIVSSHRTGKGHAVAAGESRSQELRLGQDEGGHAVSVPFADGRASAGGGRHTLVVGATGSGKTVTQTWIAVSAIEREMGAIVIDPKGDRRMRHELSQTARANRRPFIEWAPGGNWVYNPYAHGGETEIADKVLAGERYTEPHYLRQAQRYIGHVVRTLRSAGYEVSLQGIVHCLDPAHLELLARGLPETSAQPTHAYLDSLTARQRSELAGVRDRLAILAESDIGPLLDPQTTSTARFDLLEAIRARAVVYFGLESDCRPLLMQMLGAAIVQDLQSAVAALQEDPVPTLVVIDEFSAVAAEQVVRLFGRARSAGLSLLLGTQELSDLRLPGRERLLEQVMGNLSLLIAHRQVVPASAELIASLAGRRGAWRISRHSDGRTTRTRTRQAVLDPDRIADLAPGWGAVIALGRSADRIRITHINSR